MSTPTLDQLKRALQISEQIEGLKAELDAIFGGNGKVTAAVKAPGSKAKSVTKSGKRTVSPEARERMAAAQRARWSKSKDTATEVKPAAKPGKAKRTMSPEARAKIAAAAKKRWAGIKGENPAVEVKASKPAKKAKRNISPEGRAAMAAAAKKRWEGVKKS